MKLTLFNETINLYTWFPFLEGKELFCGALLTFLETYLPFLPLTAFVALNVTLFGTIKGFILSFIGSLLGAISLYGTATFFARHNWMKRMMERPAIIKIQRQFNKNSIFYISLLFMLPVFPNFIVTLLSGFHRVSLKTFAIGAALGLASMFATISYVSFNITNLFIHPIKLVPTILLIGSYYFVSKYVSAKLTTN